MSRVYVLLEDTGVNQPSVSVAESLETHLAYLQVKLNLTECAWEIAIDAEGDISMSFEHDAIGYTINGMELEK